MRVHGSNSPTVQRFRLIVVAFVMSRASFASAQGPPASVSLAVEDAIQRAVEHAPRVDEARARETAAQAAYRAKWTVALPSGSMSTGYVRNNHIDELSFPLPGGATRVLFPDIPNNYRVHAEVAVPIYAFGRVGATMASAQSDLDAAAADIRVSDADVRLDAARAYWTLVSAQEGIRVLEQALARADAYVADVKARVDAGVLAPNDLLTGQAQRARQSVRLVQARNDRALAELDLDRIVGLPPGTPIVTTSPVNRALPAAAELAGLRVEDLVSRAAGNRPEGLALNARAASLQSAATAAWMNSRPYLTGLAAVEPARPNMKIMPPTDAWKTSWSAGVNLTWPLWDAGKSRAESAALTAQADALKARRREFDDVVSLEVRQRLLDLESGRAALAASGEAVTAATEAVRVVQERFRLGVATNTDVLDAQLALLESEVEQTRLQATLRLAEARLVHAVGSR